MTVLRALTALVVVSTAAWASMPTARSEPYARLPPVPVTASPTCGGTVSAEAQAAPVQTGVRVEGGVRVAISYDAGVYDGSCSLSVTAGWTNLDTGAFGTGVITAVSTIDGHYGFIGYADTAFQTGSGTVLVTLSSHPGAELRVTA